MKTKRIAPAALLLILCLALSACRSSTASIPSAPEADSTSAPATEFPLRPTVPKQELQLDPAPGQPPENTGATRVQYTGNRASIQYITAASQLPDQEALAKYDDAYFQEHALILILETVNSGSATVGIAAIDIDGSNATVTLSHEADFEVGTTVMTTWLLWAEVDAGLDCSWTVANHALKPDGEIR